jgi:hypothetical protein
MHNLEIRNLVRWLCCCPCTGAASILFSNKPKMLRKAKYVLDKNYRVHLGSRDAAYKCIWYGPDAEGNNGIYLGKDVVNEASRALSLAMRKVAPSILTMGEIAKFAATEVQRKLSSGKVAPYKPRFTECLEGFLIHAGALTVSQWGVDLARRGVPGPCTLGSGSALLQAAMFSGYG